MPYIYSQALFCIAADSSENANGGCFNDRRSSQKLAEDPIVLRSALSDGQESTLYVYEAAYLRRAPKTLEDAPVSQRGWTFQERILSPRILHYTSEQLFWECRREYLVQDGTQIWVNNGPGRPSNTISGLVDKNKQRSWDMIQHWYRTVLQKYSARNLTHSKDRLPALSGIAQAYYQKFQCQYIAGLWAFQLGYGLTWACITPETSRQQPRHNSFSWISVETPVKWDCGMFGDSSKYPEISFQLKAYDTELINDHDPFGEVGAGSLTVTGILKKAKLSYETCDCGRQQWTVSGWTDYGVIGMGTVYMDAIPAKQQQQQDVWCLPIFWCMYYYALVLSRACTGTPDKKPSYCRLGLLRIPTERERINRVIRRACATCSPLQLLQRHRQAKVPGREVIDNIMKVWVGGCAVQEVVLV